MMLPISSDTPMIKATVAPAKFKSVINFSCMQTDLSAKSKVLFFFGKVMSSPFLYNMDMDGILVHGNLLKSGTMY